MDFTHTHTIYTLVFEKWSTLLRLPSLRSTVQVLDFCTLTYTGVLLLSLERLFLFFFNVKLTLEQWGLITPEGG